MEECVRHACWEEGRFSVDLAYPDDPSPFKTYPACKDHAHNLYVRLTKEYRSKKIRVELRG